MSVFAFFPFFPRKSGLLTMIPAPPSFLNDLERVTGLNYLPTDGAWLLLSLFLLVPCSPHLSGSFLCTPHPVVFSLPYLAHSFGLALPSSALPFALPSSSPVPSLSLFHSLFALLSPSLSSFIRRPRILTPLVQTTSSARALRRSACPSTRSRWR